MLSFHSKIVMISGLLLAGCLCAGDVGGSATGSWIGNAFLAGIAGDNWPAIPAETWKIKSEDFVDRSGAVILHERIHFRRRSLERFRRLLVLSEKGRGLAEFKLIGATITRLEGRTVSPDGLVQPFLQNSDVVKASLLSSKRENLNVVTVIPPGVTGHCVVDVRWSEPIDDLERPVPEGYDYNLLFSLSGNAPVRLAEVSFDQDVADASWVKKFEVLPGQKFWKATDNGVTTFSFEFIPARASVPFSSEADLRAPIFTWFWIPPVRDWLSLLGFPATKPITALDGAARTIIYKILAEPVSHDRGFKAELRSMSQGAYDLPLRERLALLTRSLRSKMKTISELAVVPNSRKFETSIDKALKRGWGTHTQISFVGFHLLRENGLDASLILAIDREENRMVDPNNIWQYDEMLLSVPDEKGNPIYLNPGSTFDPMGVPPWLQGSQALAIHPGAERLDWTARFVMLPVNPPEGNLQTWRALVTSSEESIDYDVKVTATGNPASGWRRYVFDQHAADVRRAIAPRVEANGFILRDASSATMSEIWADLAFQFKGYVEHSGGRQRLLQPFPFLPSPLPLPLSWPESRSLAIHTPMTTLLDAEATIPWIGPLPDFQDIAPSLHENSFGTVRWVSRVSDDDGKKSLIVKLLVKVKTLTAGASSYEELKTFSRWIQEALQRGVPAPQP